MRNSFKIAQISDTHLFADTDSLHCGANVYKNLAQVITHIRLVEKPDAIIFTGDLTQDHTDASYDRFVEIFRNQTVKIPVYFVAGNHDEFSQLNNSLTSAPFNASKVITANNWQVLLIDSKSETPAGYVNQETLHWIGEHVDPNKKQLIMMHHHPIDVGYSIDKHGLKNKEIFWSTLEKYPSIAALACGHVHNDLSLLPENTGYLLPLYTCPATSIQFDQSKPYSACNGQGAGYRIFELFEDQHFITRTYFVDANAIRVSQQGLIND